MTKTNDDLIREIAELKTEMKQMKEILNMLFTLVIESDDSDEEDFGYPGLSQDMPKFNN
jgi:hypothetical protein